MQLDRELELDRSTSSVRRDYQEAWFPGARRCIPDASYCTAQMAIDCQPVLLPPARSRAAT